MNCINKLICLSICLCAAACGNPSSKNNDIEFTDNVSEALANGGKIDLDDLVWTREPASYTIDGDTVSITTAPHTDLWQRTYYHFRNDNAPAFQMSTKEKYFSFAGGVLESLIRNIPSKPISVTTIPIIEKITVTSNAIIQLLLNICPPSMALALALCWLALML